MRKFLCGLVAVAIVLAFGCNVYSADKESGSQLSGTKLGYVDLNRCLNEVPEGKAARAKLEADGKAKKQKLEIMQNELKKMKEDLDKQRLILSADAMKEKEQQFQQKFMELQKTSVDFEQQWSKSEADAIKPIGDKIQKVIQQLGQAEGYAMIVPREMALYSANGSDLTDKVIASYGKVK